MGPVIYVRRSMKTAADADVSDEQQEAACRALLPDGLPVRVISDSGGHRSGYTASRDGYQALLALVAAGEVTALAVWDLSRLARNARLMLDLRQELERRQVTLLVATLPGTRFDGAMGRYLFGQLCLAAQLQRDMDSEKLIAITRHLFENGRHRGPAPFGYRTLLGADNRRIQPRTLVIDEAEAEAVRLVWSLLRRHSFEVVAERMNRTALQHGHDRPWSRQCIRDIWRRGPFYLGQVVEHRGSESRAGLHEPILVTEVFRDTTIAVHARTRAGPKPKAHRSYLLRGLVVCVCGARMRGEARVQRGGERRYYRCPNPACKARLVDADGAEQVTLRALAQAKLPSGVVQRSREVLRGLLAAPRDQDLAEQRNRLLRRLERLKDLYTWGDIDQGRYLSEKSDVERQLALKGEHDVLQLFDRQRDLFTSMAAALAAASPARREEACRRFVERVVARDRMVVPEDITWTGPARPFMAASWWVCPQGDSNP